MNRYIAITPARDEEALLPGLIGSMVMQRVLPVRWTIIDDGSQDQTGTIIDEAARRYPWIIPVHRERTGPRRPGGESVVMAELRRIGWADADFILRLDADLTFGPDFADLMLAEFAREPRLGIASAVLYERVRGKWRPVKAPQFHTRGAVKFYSRSCFEAIGGLESGLGWDTVDEVRAATKGFVTRSFANVRAYHHRPAGAAAGRLRGAVAQGRAAYQVGYSPLFMLARAVRRIFSPPMVVGSALMLAGFLEGYLSRTPRLSDAELIRFIRKHQLRRLVLRESHWQ